MAKRFKWYEQPFRWANILLIGITLITYLVPYINPEFSGWFSMLGLTYPILLLLNIAFLLFWLYRQKYLLAIGTFLCILLGWNYLTPSFGVNYFSSIPKVSENKLTIMSYNARNFRITEKPDPQKRADKVNQTLQIYQSTKPDLFCGQELRYPIFHLLGEAIDSNFTDLNYKVTNKKGLVIFSKYPIINSGEVRVESNNDRENISLFADIQINNELIIRVYSVHLESNKVSKTTESIELDAEKLQTKSTWRTIFNVLSIIKNNQSLRAGQMQQIVEHIKGSPYPVILCGDFNDTPLSYTFRKAKSVLQDNFTQTGKGKATTYNGNLPFLRIDYIMSDRRFNVLETEIMSNHTASDHFPVVSTVSWEF